jgi:hypothetical protein
MCAAFKLRQLRVTIAGDNCQLLKMKSRTHQHTYLALGQHEHFECPFFAAFLTPSLLSGSETKARFADGIFLCMYKSKKFWKLVAMAIVSQTR